jgi:hypothetical protein
MTGQKIAYMGVLALLFLRCDIYIVSNTASIQFLNINKETLASGTDVRYRIRNIETLGKTWNETVPYSEKTSEKEVHTHSGGFTVEGEIAVEGNSLWIKHAWEIDRDIISSETYCIDLEM